MTDNFEKDINVPSKEIIDICSYCGARECDTSKCKILDLYNSKEQECEELNKIINEAKNSKLDLKSFLVGEAMQNEYEQQLKAEKEELNEEIKNKLVIYKEIKEKSAVFTSEFSLACGAITALEWVLNLEVKNEH